MQISLLAAASENNVIGKNNQLVWNLPNDMRYFKNITWGMPVIMGRKTFDSFQGDSLPGRFNIVITRNRDWQPANPLLLVAHTLEEAIASAEQSDCTEAFVIGGGQIYREAIIIADKIYLTRVHTQAEGDSFFPEIPLSDWTLANNQDFGADTKHAYSYSFQVWERKSAEK